MVVRLLLKEIRERKDLSLNDLARLTGLSPQYLSRLENGQHNPTLSTIDSLCRGLKINPGELLIYVPDEEVR